MEVFGRSCLGRERSKNKIRGGNGVASVGFEEHEEAPLGLGLDKSRKERQAGTNAVALLIQTSLCVQWNIIGGVETWKMEIISLPCVSFLGYFSADSHSTQPWPYIHRSWEILLFWYMYVWKKLCVGRSAGGIGSVEGPFPAMLRVYWFLWEKSRRSRLFLYQEWHGGDAWWWKLSISLRTEYQALWSALQTSPCLVLTGTQEICHWHLGFTDGHMGVKSPPRLTHWGFESESLDLCFSAHFKVLLIRTSSQEASQTVQIDSKWNSMIGYKMFSRTCGNHRVGSLCWFCNNAPNEQFSNERCTCVGEPAAQPASSTHLCHCLVSAYKLRFPKCYPKKWMNGVSSIL